jgi:hypothetical protein
VSGQFGEPRSDVITGGPPGSRPRTVLAVAAVAALLVGYLVTHHGGSPARPQAAATPTAGAGPNGVAALPASASVTDVGPGPRGLRLLVGGASPRLVDASTGDATRFDLPDVGPRAPAWLVPVGDAVLAFVIPLPPGPIGAPGDPAPELPSLAVLPREAYLLRTGQPAVRLGRADSGLPARDGGLLLTRHTSAGVELSEFSANGTRRWQRRVPAGVDVLADTRAGLLVRSTTAARDSEQLGPLELVDPATGALRRRLTGNAVTVLSTRGDRVAWLSDAPCPPDCRVRVTDVTTGATRVIADRPSSGPITGAFSPDGRMLALIFGPLGAGVGVNAYPEGLVDLLDVEAGRATPVRGYSSGLYPPGWVEWTPDGRLVVMALATIGRERVKVVVAQRPGRPGRFTMLPWEFLATRSIAIAG